MPFREAAPERFEARVLRLEGASAETQEQLALNLGARLVLERDVGKLRNPFRLLAPVIIGMLGGTAGTVLGAQAWSPSGDAPPSNEEQAVAFCEHVCESIELPYVHTNQRCSLVHCWPEPTSCVCANADRRVEFYREGGAAVTLLLAPGE